MNDNLYDELVKDIGDLMGGHANINNEVSDEEFWATALGALTCSLCKMYSFRGKVDADSIKYFTDSTANLLTGILNRCAEELRKDSKKGKAKNV